MARLDVSGLVLETRGDSLLMDGRPMACAYRKLSEMRDVLMDSSAADGADGSVATYFMFRSVIMGSDAGVFAEHSVRFDVTVMPSMRLGMERNKTFGHYHPEAEAGLGFPEVYAVVDGRAAFIMQKRLEGGGFDVEVVRARSGDVILMPPNYGHITVNEGHGRLVLANLVSSAFVSDYKSIAAMHGGAVYIKTDGTQVANAHYDVVSMKRFDSPPKSPALEGLNSANIYEEFVKDPERFAFLNKPSLL